MNSKTFSYTLILAATLGISLWIPASFESAQAARAENNRLSPIASAPALTETALITEPLNSDRGKFNSLEAIRHSVSGSR
ncbi:TPA: hypothetical protein DD394_04375, partial [bacterium UBP9_UBA11836]|nr:hypothetical protein [bacterium UBP9_UBA11836]